MRVREGRGSERVRETEREGGRERGREAGRQGDREGFLGTNPERGSRAPRASTGRGAAAICARRTKAEAARDEQLFRV